MKRFNWYLIDPRRQRGAAVARCIWLWPLRIRAALSGRGRELDYFRPADHSFHATPDTWRRVSPPLGVPGIPVLTLFWVAVAAVVVLALVVEKSGVL